MVRTENYAYTFYHKSNYSYLSCDVPGNDIFNLADNILHMLPCQIVIDGRVVIEARHTLNLKKSSPHKQMELRK